MYLSQESGALWKPQFSQMHLQHSISSVRTHEQRSLPSTMQVFNKEHLLQRPVLVQIPRGLIKSQLVGEGQFSKIRGFSVNSDTAPPLNIPCPFICGLVNGPLPMYLYPV